MTAVFLGYFWLRFHSVTDSSLILKLLTALELEMHNHLEINGPIFGSWEASTAFLPRIGTMNLLAWLASFACWCSVTALSSGALVLPAGKDGSGRLHAYCLVS